MSDQTQADDELSIEEILDSIRQIISEDDEDGAETTPPVEETAAPVVEDEPLGQDAIDAMDFDAPAPVLEDEPLGQDAIDAMDFDGPAVEDEPLGQDAIDAMDFGGPVEEAPEEEDEVLDLTEKVDPEPEPDPEPIQEPEEEPEPIPEPIPEPEPPVNVEAPSDHLLSQNAESAAVSAISELVRKTAVEHNGVTIEEIVRSELKPLLRDWLDKNLPAVIERLVQEELERVSKRVLED